MTKAERRKEALRLLEEVYGDTKPALTYRSPFELLVAVMLSAQCTDVRVNAVTDELFPELGAPERMAALTADELEPRIRSCGLSKTKSKNIVAMSHILLESHGGQVPETIEALETLPGVGRKTANVVASVAFGVPAIAVDTHVFRVANRIGLAAAKDVKHTEEQLMAAIPKDKWSRAHHWLIWHGRRVCAARKPLCDTCALQGVCDHARGIE